VAMVYEPKKVREGVYEIPKQGDMRVPGKIFASQRLLSAIQGDPCIQQVVNVATLPGIMGFSIAMSGHSLGVWVSYRRRGRNGRATWRDLARRRWL